MAMEQLTISSEDDAFSFIEKALKHEISDTPLELKFNNWPVLEIKLQGVGYQSTITAEMAQALVELQQAMNRTYARTVRHSANARSLTDEDRNGIRFKAKVENGSSLIKIDLGPFAEKLAMSVVDKMTPELLVITVLGTAAAAGGAFAYKAFLKHRSEDKKISVEAEKSIAMSKEETRRLEIFANAVKTAPVLGHVCEDFDEARHGIIRGTADAQSLTFSDVTLDSKSAHVVAMTKRSESKALQLNGNYFIKKADWQIDGEVRLTISHEESHRVFVASFRDDSLKKEQTKIIEEAEWSRCHVYLSVNATELRGEITTATIIDVKAQPDLAVEG